MMIGAGWLLCEYLIDIKYMGKWPELSGLSATYNHSWKFNSEG